MRKIKSEAELEAKRKKNARYLTFFMLFVLLIGTVGYAFLMGDRQSKGTNSGEDMQWIDFGKQRVYLTNPKSAVGNTSINITEDLSFYGNEKVYVASKSDNIYYEISNTLGRITERIQKACYGKCAENLPEKNCSDKLIIWNPSQENKVYQKENCVFIDGDLRTVDAFLYHIFG